MLYKDTDVDEHIQNISSYDLSFFQKLILCRGLKFAFPQQISSIEVKASFEKAYWSLGVLTFYKNHPVGNLGHKHYTITSDVAGDGIAGCKVYPHQLA